MRLSDAAPNILVRAAFAWKCLPAVAAIVLTPSAVHAVTSNWSNNSGGAFTTAGNWDNGVPGDGDIAVFDRGSGVVYTVTFSSLGGSITSDRLVVGSNAATFNPNIAFPANFFLDNATTLEAHTVLGTPVRGITIGADAGDTAAVLVSHLSLLQAVAATLGHAAGSNGTLTLEQNNDLLNITGGSTTDAELIVGRLGTGVLNVSGGADVAVNGTTGGMFPLPAGNVILGRGSSGHGTANINGNGSTLDAIATITVGESGTGVLNISGGGFVESITGFLGNLADSTGTATISGAGSRWRALVLNVGVAGTGTLNVLDGGIVEFANPSGYLSIGSLGTLNLNTGTIGGDVNNSGQIHVTGPATIAGSLDVAVNANTLIDWGEPCCGMTLEVAGGVTNSGTFGVASSVERDVTIQLGAGQSFVNNATGVVNLDGPGDLDADETISARHVIAGNVVNHGQLNVRTNAQITGSLDNTVNADTLIDWGAPCCAMTLEVAGGVTNSGTFTMQMDSIEPCCNVALELAPGQSFANNPTGVLNLNGPANVPQGQTIESKDIIDGNVVNHGQMNVRTNAQITGSLTIAVDAETLMNPAEPCCGIALEVDGGVANSGTMALVPDPDSATPCCAVTVALGIGQSLTNNETGVLLGQGIIDGSVLNAGTVRPGNSTGVLTITGDYAQESGGRLVVEVAGTTAGDEYDQLAIGGAIQLDGVVEVVFADDFTPQIGNRFEIITTAEPPSGKFVGAALPGLPEGMAWNIVYRADLVSLVTTVPGDYNGDGSVDAADYVVWRNTLDETPPAGTGADGDGSGTVDEGDYLVWMSNFGSTAASGFTALAQVTVPEPTGLLMFAVAASLILTRSRPDTCRLRSLWIAVPSAGVVSFYSAPLVTS